MAHRHLLILVLLRAFGAAAAAEPARDRHGDPLPDGAVARLGSLHLRQESWLSVAAFSPDGKYLATAGSGPIYLWDPSTGKEMRRLPLKDGGGAALDYSTGGKALTVATTDGAIHEVDLLRGTVREKWRLPNGESLVVLDVRREAAVTADKEGVLAIRELATGKCLRTIKGPSKAVHLWADAVALTPDGKRLVLPHADGSLHLVNVASGVEELALEMSPEAADDARNFQYAKIAVAADGRYLAYRSTFTNLAVCDLKTGKCLHKLPDTKGIGAPAFAPDGHSLAVNTFDTISLFAIPSGDRLRKMPKPLQAGRRLIFSPDGKALAALWWNGCTLTLLDVATGRALNPAEGHLETVRSLVFFPDGRRLVSADGDGLLLVWDIAGRIHARREPPPTQHWIHSLTVASDGTTLQFLRYDRAVHRWDPEAGDREEIRAFAPKLGPGRFALSPDGRFLATSNRAAPWLHLHDLKTNEGPRPLALPENGWQPRLLVFSPDGRWLAADCAHVGPHLWDRANDWKPHPMNGDAGLRHIAFAGDGRSLAAGDRRIHVREIAGGGERLVVPLLDSPSALAYAPNGRFLATANEREDSIRIHSTGRGKQLARWRAGQGGVKTLAFSRDGRLLASSGHNGTILLWKVPEDDGLPAILKRDEAASFWQALHKQDAASANRALAGLAAAPAQAIPLIKECFRTTWRPADAARLSRLIRDLDSDTFASRERASRELADVGYEAIEPLRRALADGPSPEMRRRIEDLLDRLQNGGSERLRSLRALEILERIGTPQAKDVLRELSRKTLPADLADEVRASLRRMGDRP